MEAKPADINWQTSDFRRPGCQMARARLAPDYSNPGPILKLPLDGNTPVPLKFSFVVFVVCWTRCPDLYPCRAALS